MTNLNTEMRRHATVLPEQNADTVAGRFRTVCATRLLPLLLFLLLPAAVQAQYTYTTNDSAITITRYTGSGGAVTITNLINGYLVTSIGSNAFHLCTSVTSVTIPNSVTKIEYSAFDGCSSMTSVMIPNSVITIGDYAFDGCSSLTSLTIPNSVTNIGVGAFQGNSAFTSVTIPTNVTSIGAFTFMGCTSLTSITIPNRVASIGPNAFFQCFSLTNVTVGNSVISIGDDAFCACTNLTGVTIPTSVNSIGKDVFLSCTSLNAISVNTNNSFYSSVNGVLFNKNQTTLIQYPNGRTGSYTIPDSVTGFGYDAFRSCSGLTSVMIPSGVTNIGYGAFWGCSGLTSITIPNSVTSIGDFAFYWCSGLTSVTIPNSVSSIGGYAFSSCTNLSSVTILNSSVTLIEQLAFGNCTSLTGVYCQGNAFGCGGNGVFSGDNNATIYYLPGATGWSTPYCGLPTTQSSLIIVTVTADPSNGGTVSGSGPYPVGTNVQISAGANIGWTFTGWSDGNMQTPRTITVALGGATYTANFACTCLLSTTSTNVAATSGSGSFSVTGGGSCAWTAKPNVSWLHTSSSGTGNGTVNYTCDANGGTSSRANHITVGGETFTVTQDGNAAPQVGIALVAPITLPVTMVNLNATVTDDGAPSGTLNGTWSKTSGPGTVSFGNAGTFNTTATFSTNGTYWLQLVASDGALTGTGTVAVAVNIRPVVVTPPAVSNAVATINGVPVVVPGDPLTFTAAATDPDGDALACSWSFGDGVSSVDCQPSHVFSNCGPHAVAYVVTDGISPVTNTLLLVVACPFEVSPKPVSLSMKVNFAPNKLDTASLKGVIDLPVGVATTNIPAQLSIGSVDVPFALDGKGRGLNGYGSLKLSPKGKPVLSSQLWQVTGNFKGDFDAMWASDGLANTNVLNQPITVPVLLLLDSDPPESFYIEKPLLYKATAGKSGTAK